MDIQTQLRTEITIINQTMADFGIDAGTKPGWTTIAGRSFVAYGIRTGAQQRQDAIARILPELSERISASRRRPAPVRMRELPLTLEVQHPTPAPLDWRAATMRIGAARLLAGRNYSTTPAQDCTIALDSRPHILVAGTTGSGKSTILRMMLASLAYNSDPDAVRLVLVDRKNEDLVPFGDLPHVAAAAYTAADARTAITRTHAELQRRVDAGLGDWQRIVLVIDELAQLDEASLTTLGSILAVGRSKRVHVIAATQHPTVRLIGDKSNYAVRIVGQVVDGTTAALATGRRGTGAELLPGAGAFLYVDGATLDRIQAYNLDAAATGPLVRSICEKWGATASTTTSTPVELPAVEPTSPVEPEVEDEISRIARIIEPMWRSGASKSQMAKAALDRQYAGSYAAKIDKALALLASTTTARTHASTPGQTPASASGSVVVEPARIIRMVTAR